MDAHAAVGEVQDALVDGIGQDRLVDLDEAGPVVGGLGGAAHLSVHEVHDPVRLGRRRHLEHDRTGQQVPGHQRRERVEELAQVGREGVPREGDARFLLGGALERSAVLLEARREGGLGVGEPVVAGQREPLRRRPRVTRRQDRQLGVLDARRSREGLGHLDRGDQVRVDPPALGVQERHHVGEGHRVVGLEPAGGVHEVVDVGLAREQGEIGRVLGLVADRVRLRPRVGLEQERRMAEVVGHLIERAAPDLAVVEVGQHVVAVGHQERRVVEAVLVRRHPDPRGELGDLPVRELGDPIEAQRAHLATHHVHPEPGHEHLGALVDPAHRRVVEVIEVVVGEVHVVGREPLGPELLLGREVPPGAPVARPREPGVDQDGRPGALTLGTVGLDVQAGVADHGEAHAVGTV